MKSGKNYKSIYIDITTYKNEFKKNKRIMEKDRLETYQHNQNRFICSICLNKDASEADFKCTAECCKQKTKSCPLCQKTESEKEKDSHKCPGSGKNIPTSHADFTQGLTLLNEVLTVFHNKKQFETKKDKNKTIILKDASVSTERYIPKLSVSKVFIYSILEDVNYNCKCTVINCQPETKSQFSIDLSKHKSSSIPQMKLDEIKHTFKQKTKSKDAIEEVNRMFATVRKLDITDSNRPMVRNGPRVLPVVKTENKLGENIVATPKCNCQNDKMSSGDSIECCQKRKKESLCMCCHCQHYLNIKCCVNCRKAFDEHNGHTYQGF